MMRFVVGTTVWAAALVAGFVLVFTLGRPLPNTDELLHAAYQPATPVSQAAAKASAAIIVKLQYPHLAATTPTVTRRTDFGIDRWLIVYVSGGDVPDGVQISVGITTGQVEVATFP